MPEETEEVDEEKERDVVVVRCGERERLGCEEEELRDGAEEEAGKGGAVGGVLALDIFGDRKGRGFLVDSERGVLHIVQD